MENNFQSPHMKFLTGSKRIAICVFLLAFMTLDFENRKNPTQPNIIVQVIKEFPLTNWLPLEFSQNGNSASKYFSFFIGEIFVYYIIVNTLHNVFLWRRNSSDYFVIFEHISKLLLLQSFFIIFRMKESMEISNAISLCALFISLFIYKDFCRSRWETRGLKEEAHVRSDIDLIIGSTFPEEVDSMALLTYIILCFVGYGNVPNVMNFFLCVGSCIYCFRLERLMVILIGLLSVNIPLFLLAIINSRPLSNFTNMEWNCYDKRKEVKKTIPVPCATPAIVETNRKNRSSNKKKKKCYL